MKNPRLKLAFITLVALLPLTAFAETTPSRASLSKNPKTLSYLTSKSVEEKLIEHGKRFDDFTGMACDAPGTVKFGADKVSVIKPIELASGAQHPEDGGWIYKFDFTRCGRSTTLNVAAFAQKDSPPRYASLLPGDTIASPTLQNDAIVILAQKVMIEAKVRDDKECRDLAIFNTSLVTLPALSSSGGAGGRWEESWLMRYCGKSFALPVCFTPNARGTAIFSASCEETPRSR